MTLKNKLGIHNAVELSRQEERLSKQRALELFDEGLLDTFEIGTFAGLQAIHAHLFCDVFSADDPLTSGIHGVIVSDTPDICMSEFQNTGGRRVHAVKENTSGAVIDSINQSSLHICHSVIRTMKEV